MKVLKVVLAIGLLGTVIFAGYSPVQSSGNKGAVQQTEADDYCTSGRKRKCEGVGNVCELTLGWDCVTTTKTIKIIN